MKMWVLSCMIFYLYFEQFLSKEIFGKYFYEEFQGKLSEVERKTYLKFPLSNKDFQNAVGVAPHVMFPWNAVGDFWFGVR